MKLKMLPFAAVAAIMPVMAVAQDAPATTAPTAISIPTEDGFVPFKCPIEKIRSAYSQLVDPEDTLVALAIEKQTLAICRQSQEALLRIAENEQRLEELFEPIIAPPVVEVVQAPAAEPEPAVPTIGTVAPEEVIAEPVIEEPAVPERAAPTPPPYDLAAVMKDPIGWKAMLVDDQAIFTVRAGDRMEDGSLVTSIADGKVVLTDADDNSFTLE